MEDPFHFTLASGARELLAALRQQPPDGGGGASAAFWAVFSLPCVGDAKANGACPAALWVHSIPPPEVAACALAGHDTRRLATRGPAPLPVRLKPHHVPSEVPCSVHPAGGGELRVLELRRAAALALGLADPRTWGDSWAGSGAVELSFCGLELDEDAADLSDVGIDEGVAVVVAPSPLPAALSRALGGTVRSGVVLSGGRAPQPPPPRCVLWQCPGGRWRWALYSPAAADPRLRSLAAAASAVLRQEVQAQLGAPVSAVGAGAARLVPTPFAEHSLPQLVATVRDDLAAAAVPPAAA